MQAPEARQNDKVTEGYLFLSHDSPRRGADADRLGWKHLSQKKYMSRVRQDFFAPSTGHLPPAWRQPIDESKHLAGIGQGRASLIVPKPGTSGTACQVSNNSTSFAEATRSLTADMASIPVRNAFNWHALC